MEKINFKVLMVRKGVNKLMCRVVYQEQDCRMSEQYGRVIIRNIDCVELRAESNVIFLRGCGNPHEVFYDFVTESDCEEFLNNVKEANKIYHELPV